MYMMNVKNSQEIVMVHVIDLGTMFYFPKFGTDAPKYPII
jgi:hypothetical protein